ERHQPEQKLARARRARKSPPSPKREGMRTRVRLITPKDKKTKPPQQAPGGFHPRFSGTYLAPRKLTIKSAPPEIGDLPKPSQWLGRGAGHSSRGMRAFATKCAPCRRPPRIPRASS